MVLNKIRKKNKKSKCNSCKLIITFISIIILLVLFFLGFKIFNKTDGVIVGEAKYVDFNIDKSVISITFPCETFIVPVIEATNIKEYDQKFLSAETPNSFCLNKGFKFATNGIQFEEKFVYSNYGCSNLIYRDSYYNSLKLNEKFPIKSSQVNCISEGQYQFEAKKGNYLINCCK